VPKKKLIELMKYLIDTNVLSGAVKTAPDKSVKVTSAMQKDALEMARTYEVLFKNDADSSVLPVVRVHHRTDETAKKIAMELRKRVGISQDLLPELCRFWKVSFDCEFIHFF